MDASHFNKVNGPVLQDVHDNQMFKRFLKGRLRFVIIFLSWAITWLETNYLVN